MFFKIINQGREHPLFVFGESYAGKYVPAIGEKILREPQLARANAHA